MLKFSVVIAVYNKEKYISRTLASVLGQSFSHFEVIIVNDGSTDQSESVIKSFDDRRIRYFTQENKGAATARNEGIRKAKAPYIALLDADDEWLPHFLEEQYRLVSSYPQEFIFATAQEIVKNNKTYPKVYSLPKGFVNEGVLNYFEASFFASILHSSSTVVRKEVFDKVGLYNPSIKSGQDTELYIRMGLHYSVVFSNRICSRYYILKNSLFRSSTSLAEKADFSSYEALAKTNPSFKKFLDLNAFSHAIFAKSIRDEDGFSEKVKYINMSNLSSKQRFLLRQSSTSIRILYAVKRFLERFEIHLSAFR